VSHTASNLTTRRTRSKWDLVDQAYGKTPQQVEVKAGPLGDLSAVPTEELKRQAAEMREKLELSEKTG
jgi:hypothetical protein